MKSDRYDREYPRNLGILRNRGADTQGSPDADRGIQPRQAQQAGVQADEFIRRLLRWAPHYHAWVVETGHHLTDLSPSVLASLGQCNLCLRPGQQAL